MLLVICFLRFSLSPLAFRRYDTPVWPISARACRRLPLIVGGFRFRYDDFHSRQATAMSGFQVAPLDTGRLAASARHRRFRLLGATADEAIIHRLFSKSFGSSFERRCAFIHSLSFGSRFRFRCALIMIIAIIIRRCSLLDTRLPSMLSTA